jgi:hypothetical protein
MFEVLLKKFHLQKKKNLSLHWTSVLVDLSVVAFCMGFAAMMNFIKVKPLFLVVFRILISSFEFAQTDKMSRLV